MSSLHHCCRLVVGRLLVLLLALFGAPQGFAYTGGMAVDMSFGAGGFTSIPPYDGTYTISSVIGFVRMPLSGGYLVFSKQAKAGVDHVVATRVTNEGGIDTAWGSGGQMFYAVAVPTGSDALVVAGSESGVERVYLIGRIVADKGYLMVATFGADGALVNFGSSSVADSFGAAGVGEVLSAEAGSTLGGGAGVLVALKGAGAAAGTVALAGATTISGQPGSIYPGSYALVRSLFRIDWMRNRGDGNADLLGTENNHAVYLRFNPATVSIESETIFDLPCTTGSPTSSVADGLVRPSGFAGDALVTGRVSCSSGETYSLVTRVASIESSPSVAWGTPVETALNTALIGTCQLPFADSGCVTTNIEYSSAMPTAEVFVTTTYLTVAHLDIGATPAKLTGTDFNIEPPSVLPSQHLGSYLDYPRIVALAQSGSQLGLSRISIDRIFADRIDMTP